ncbi:hypothetical protein SeMB42_g00274 [Synchytrium endobioticum]|uniref:Uncharacterized protein n=1 Tax=Synchytrium endobioticum TaxID=286115 RepID=A0A507DHW9_9FUNG|nr:hypothetical protein SeLEV6574_g00397 [Synchytrium endobioticum]TPX54426.1 hypothetical protein SeMB42_g00274 [Synchytrium endobioticum]
MDSGQYDDIVRRAPSAPATIAFLLTGGLVSLLPIYLYSGIAALNIKSSLVVVALSVAFTVAGLVFSYANFNYTRQLSLHRQVKQAARETTSSASKRNAKAQAAKTLNTIKTASVAWSLFIGNAIYLAVFALGALGTWGMQSVDLRLLGTAVVPGVLVAALSMPVDKQ